MQTQLAMRELTLDEIDAVSGAGFWSDLWESISGAFTASADFLGSSVARCFETFLAAALRGLGSSGFDPKRRAVCAASGDWRWSGV